MLRQRVAVGLALTVAISLRVSAEAPTEQQQSDRPSVVQPGVLQGYAAATRRSLVAMTDPRTGPVVDHLSATDAYARYTSPTNITPSIWSTLAIRPLLAIEELSTSR